MFGMNNHSLRRLHNAEINRIAYFRRLLVAIAVAHSNVTVTLIKRPSPNAARRIDLFEPAEKSAEKDVVQDDGARNLDHQVAHVIMEVRIPHLIDDAVDYGVIGTQPRRIVNREINSDRRGIDFFLIGDQDNVVVPGERRKKIGAVIAQCPSVPAGVAKRTQDADANAAPAAAIGLGSETPPALFSSALLSLA